MTCRRMGGPWDAAFAGTADDVIKAQDRHLNEMVDAGDTTHEEALEQMKGRWKNPVKGNGLVQADEEGLRSPARG